MGACSAAWVGRSGRAREARRESPQRSGRVRGDVGDAGMPRAGRVGRRHRPALGAGVACRLDGTRRDPVREEAAMRAKELMTNNLAVVPPEMPVAAIAELL